MSNPGFHTEEHAMSKSAYTIKTRSCASMLLSALILLVHVTTQAQDNSSPPDCSKLTPQECVMLSKEWVDQLEKSRETGDGWSVGCYRDRVTLEWSCFATKSFGRSALRVQHNQTLGYCFLGPLNDHPGMSAIIRIGENQPIRYTDTLVCFAKAKEIIKQLKGETEGAARGNIWPNRTEEFEFNSKGFPTALEALKDRVANPRP
jgi:hypothetical protein